MANIYVGNLPFQTSEDDLRGMFAEHGSVDNVSIIVDKMTGRSRGFGFVEMPNGDEATAAINALNGTEVQGRALTVNEARPKTDNRGGGGFRGGRDRY